MKGTLARQRRDSLPSERRSARSRGTVTLITWFTSPVTLWLLTGRVVRERMMMMVFLMTWVRGW